MRQLFRDQNIDMAKIALWRAGQAVAPNASNAQSAIWLYDSIKDSEWQKYLVATVPPVQSRRSKKISIIYGYLKTGINLTAPAPKRSVKTRKHYKDFIMAKTSKEFEQFLKFDADLGQHVVDWLNPKIQAIVFECFMDCFCVENELQSSK